MNIIKPIKKCINIVFLLFEEVRLPYSKSFYMNSNDSFKGKTDLINFKSNATLHIFQNLAYIFSNIMANIKCVDTLLMIWVISETHYRCYAYISKLIGLSYVSCACTVVQKRLMWKISKSSEKFSISSLQLSCWI